MKTPSIKMTPIEKLEFALLMMKARKHDTAGLGAPMVIIQEAIEELKQLPA